jgi:predicted DNA-binding transcriptional regulator YafY
MVKLDNLTEQRLYMDKIRRVLTLMVQMQQRDMPVHVIAKELQVTERTAYRYLRLFKDIGIKVDQNIYGAYTIQPTTIKKRKAKRNESNINI